MLETVFQFSNQTINVIMEIFSAGDIKSFNQAVSEKADTAEERGGVTVCEILYHF